MKERERERDAITTLLEILLVSNPISASKKKFAIAFFAHFKNPFLYLD